MNNFPLLQNSTDIHITEYQNKQIILVGTAHISPQSAQIVEEAILFYKPNIVCLELDKKRFEALTQKKHWESLNFKQIIKEKKLATLFVQLVLSSYQSRMGKQLKTEPGLEMLKGKDIAESQNIPIVLCDREVGITLRRTWRKTPFFKKMSLIGALFSSLFDSSKIDESKINELKKKDLMSNMMEELGQYLPTIKKILIDERDIYLAEKIKSQSQKVILAVVGAGHVLGMLEQFKKPVTDLKSLEIIPSTSKVYKMFGWGISLAIILSLIFITLQNGLENGGEDLIFWFVINASLSGVGALIALAHPLTFLASLLSPLTSLTPIIGVGYVCALVQVITQPPTVKNLSEIRTDIKFVSRWWSNRALKIFLVLILTSLGSFLASGIGGAKIFTSLIRAVQSFFGV